MIRSHSKQYSISRRNIKIFTISYSFIQTVTRSRNLIGTKQKHNPKIHFFSWSWRYFSHASSLFSVRPNSCDKFLFCYFFLVSYGFNHFFHLLCIFVQFVIVYCLSLFIQSVFVLSKREKQISYYLLKWKKNVDFYFYYILIRVHILHDYFAGISFISFSVSINICIGMCVWNHSQRDASKRSILSDN